MDMSKKFETELKKKNFMCFKYENNFKNKLNYYYLHLSNS